MWADTNTSPMKKSTHCGELRGTELAPHSGP